MTTNNPLISVIVNCHNGQKYLDSCIKSILKQSYKNFEIIFFDNFSSDNSYQTISMFKDSRIKIFKSDIFLTLPEARNQAINKSNGEFIAILDTDDKADAKRLEKQINFMLDNKEYGAISANCIFIDDDGKMIQKSDLPLDHSSIATKIFWSYPFNNPTLFIRREILEKVGGYPEKFKFINDYALMFEIFNISRVANLKEFLGYYRVHKNNLTNKYSVQMEIELLKFLQKLLKYNSNNHKLSTFYFYLKCLLRVIIKKFSTNS